MRGESGGMTSRFIPAALLTAALTAGSASAADRNFTVTSFDRIRVDGPFKVRLTTGVAPFARASGSPAAIDSVSIDVQGRTLVVRGNPSSWSGYPGEARGPVEIAVGTHELSKAWLNGPGALAIDRIEGLEFDLAIQGSGTAAIADASVDRLNIGISGAGSATIAGTAPRLTAIVRGTSNLDASGLAAKDVTVGAEGPSTVRVSASSSVEVDARGVASVNVSGGAACTVRGEGSAVVSGCERRAR
jgi:hypothetical protein